jgi:hypothetical protein
MNGPFDGGTRYSDSCSQELKSLYCTCLGSEALEGHCHKTSVGKEASELVDIHRSLDRSLTDTDLFYCLSIDFPD